MNQTIFSLQPTVLPMHSEDLTAHMISPRSNNNIPLSENSENDSQLIQMEHSDNIDGKFKYIYILYIHCMYWSTYALYNTRVNYTIEFIIIIINYYYYHLLMDCG